MKGDEYLKVTERNVALLDPTPSFLGIKDMTPRRDRYEFQPYADLVHLEVYPDGYFHTNFPISSKDNIVKLGTVMCCVSSFLFFAVRIMKLRGVTTKQRMHLELSGLANKEISTTQSVFSLRRHYFPRDREDNIFETVLIGLVVGVNSSLLSVIFTVRYCWSWESRVYPKRA